MRSLLEPTFGPLWVPLGPLLGGSWASLGRPWASKMGSKRVGNIEIRVSFIPSCFFCRFFRLRSASGSLLGGFWPHLGAIWAHLGTFFRDFWSTSWDAAWTLGSTMNRQLDQQKMVPIISKQPGPAECAKRSAAPWLCQGGGVFDGVYVLKKR